MTTRARVKTASQIVARLVGYPDLGTKPTCANQESMLNVACETLSRYMLGEIDEDKDFDGIDMQCLAIAEKIRRDPEWEKLTIGDRFAVKHRKVALDGDTNGYVLWLEQIADGPRVAFDPDEPPETETVPADS